MINNYDIKAQITVTNKDKCFSGYRPAHLINNYLTTGIHTYIGTDCLRKGESTEGYIKFISPEYYPHTMKVGDKIVFQEGANVVGYIEILEILNDLLKA